MTNQKDLHDPLEICCSKTERTAVFIDGSNLYSTSRKLSFDVDYRNLRQLLGSHTDLVRVYYYSAILENEEYSPLKPLTDWLAYNGFTLITKNAREFTDASGRRRVKGNMDVELAVNMLQMAPHIRHAILFSGDADFTYLIKAVQAMGVKVTVISSILTDPPMIGDELRRQADTFIEIQKIAPAFTRRQTEPRQRPTSVETEDLVDAE